MLILGIFFMIVVSPNAHRTYTIQPNLTAVYDHVAHPFTQGLAVWSKCSDLGLELDECLKAEKVDQCLESVLLKCVSVYESSGGYGSSYLQVVQDFKTGKPTSKKRASDNFFLEGLTILRDDLILVGTWKEKRLLVLTYTNNTLENMREYLITDPSEIWGVASSADKLYITSGDGYLYVFHLSPDLNSSAQLIFAAENRRPISHLHYDEKIKLVCEKKQLYLLNELEFNIHTNTLWGNVWMKDVIYEMDPRRGVCIGSLRLQMADLKFPDTPFAVNLDSVWNGLAFLSKDWMLFTGKNFKYVYLTKLQ